MQRWGAQHRTWSSGVVLGDMIVFRSAARATPARSSCGCKGESILKLNDEKSGPCADVGALLK